MARTIYLFVENHGWKDFDLDSETVEAELTARGIKIHPGSRASIGYGASIGSRASIGDGASIGYGASIGDGASIGSGASIGYGASIGSGASIDKDEKVKSVCICGTKHFISWWGRDIIQIGCKQYTIAEWQASYDKIGRSQGYDQAQRDEYGVYIDMIAALYEKVKPQPVTA
jgi:carbonic anhydrase/acetyltransferase-like protein (isoleucine patch superfamily)